MADNLLAKQTNKQTSKQYYLVFILGFLTVVILYHAALLRGMDLKAIVHDEYDGELLTYILQARHLSIGFLPELFNGTSKAAMTPPAPLFVLLYTFLKPELAFYISFVLILLTAYTGMYLLVNQRFDEPVIAAVTGTLFTLLPFYPVYGLSVMGQPLLFYAFGRLRNGKKRVGLLGILLIVFFSLSSSLVLVGLQTV